MHGMHGVAHLRLKGHDWTANGVLTLFICLQILTLFIDRSVFCKDQRLHCSECIVFELFLHVCREQMADMFYKTATW